jgi:hypothetical protein
MKKIILSKLAVIIYLFFTIFVLNKIYHNYFVKNKSAKNLAFKEVSVELSKVSKSDLKPNASSQVAAPQNQRNIVKNDNDINKSKSKKPLVAINNPKSNKSKIIAKKLPNHQSKKHCLKNKLAKQNNIQFKIPPRIEQSLSTNSKRNSAETKFLFPLYQNKNADQLAYIDLRAGIDNSTSHKTDLTLGFRKLLSNTNFLNQKQWIIGTYGAIGRSYGRYKNEFQQKSFGIEALSLNYDFRANFYLAENKEKHIDDSLAITPDFDADIYWNTTNLKRQKALKGADFELGYKIPTTIIDAKIYAGGYYYQKPKNSNIILGQYDSILSNNDYNSVNGQKLRLELNFNHNNIKLFNKNTNLTLSTEYKHDRLDQGQLFIITKLSYQFGNNFAPPTKLDSATSDNNKNSQQSTDMRYRMNEFVIRNDIVTDQRGEVVKTKGGVINESGDAQGEESDEEPPPGENE